MSTVQALYVGAIVGIALAVLWQRVDELDARIQNIEYGRIATALDKATVKHTGAVSPAPRAEG